MGSRDGGPGGWLGLNGLVGKGYELQAATFLLLFEVAIDCPKVVIESRGMCRPNVSNLLYDGIIHEITFFNSSGVQMMGAL